MTPKPPSRQRKWQLKKEAAPFHYIGFTPEDIKAAKAAFLASKGNPSRQRLWQERKRAAGLCSQCGKESDGAVKCPGCREKANAHIRQLRGFKPWQPGSVGRRPFEVREAK